MTGRPAPLSPLEGERSGRTEGGANTLTLAAARDCLDLHVLEALGSDTETASHLRHLTCEPWITREIARAICRDLAARGLVAFQRGLFTEDGKPAGAGYGITPAGLTHYHRLLTGGPVPDHPAANPDRP